ncbi:ADP-ribosylglycohydrolase family protein [Merismopedia glauca]|uniref:ADP-ribosylglycohydrolase family protein n=1 Tax=Merismopedia glauca CCAP 1448/3 TaxID=1296344 RepID=A0A2T1BZ40_9CYAN|nr:hypothetical protein C7B64_19875 [Merismopedia glauca CCAP 1448/3]
MTYLNWAQYFFKSEVREEGRRKKGDKPINNQQSTINNQQSTINNQQSTINNQQSMRYSLLSRFKGTLLGMMLAEVYASQHLPKSTQMSDRLSHLTQFSARQFINFAKIENIPDDIEQSTKLNSLEPKIYPALAIAIPIALLAHEQEAKLLEQLGLAVTTNPTLQTSWEGMLAISYVISQALTERLQTEQLISKICHFLRDNSAELIEELNQVQSWLETPASLEKVRRHSRNFNHGAISLAIYSFLGTPEDYILTVQRAFHLSDDPFLTCALAGAISGAYNGVGSIPVSWYLWLDPHQEEEIEQLSAQLLASWSGVYQPHGTASISTSLMPRRGSYAIAAPQVMCRRDRG